MQRSAELGARIQPVETVQNERSALRGQSWLVACDEFLRERQIACSQIQDGSWNLFLQKVKGIVMLPNEPIDGIRSHGGERPLRRLGR